MRKFLFLALAACMLQISASAFSDGAGLTLDAGVSGVTVKVYDVGSVRDGAYVLDDAFSRYGTDLNVDGAADELAGSFRKDGMACLRYGVTDEYGRVEFGGLGPGVYLASCDGFESGGAAFRRAAGRTVSVWSRGSVSAGFAGYGGYRHGLLRRRGGMRSGHFDGACVPQAYVVK